MAYSATKHRVTRIEGLNFSVEEHDSGIAVVRVWRRPDLSRDEGARCAQLIADHMERLAGKVRSCVFDLTRATTSWGPATHRAVRKMIAVWEAATKPIYIVPARDAIQRLLLREIQREVAPHRGHLVESHEAALAALAAEDAKSTARHR